MENALDNLGGIQSLATLSDPFGAWQRGILANQTQQQNENILATQRAELDKQALLQQRQRQYQADLAAIPQGGNMFLGMSRMIAKYPEFKEALKAAYDGADEQMQRTELRQASDIYHLVKNGLIDKAMERLHSRIQADRNAGGYQTGAEGADTGGGADPSFFEGQLALLKTGNPKAIAAVQDGLASFMAAVVPDKFAAVNEQLGRKPADKRVMRPGDILLDEDNKPIFSAPFAPQTATVEPGKQIVEWTPGAVGSGTQGGSSDARFTGGWTPRARNGGDNDDAAVDNKISGASQFLGVSPDADLRSLSPMKIAQAMTLSEGGAGSLADRNNNPANIKGAGGEGGFRRFPTKQAGMNAAAALVVRKLKNGQTSVRSLIEGLPVGGAGGNGGVRVIADGGPKQAPVIPQGVRMTPDENEAEGLPRDVVYYRNKFGVPEPVGGQAKPGSTQKDGAYSQSALDAFDRAISTANRLKSHPGLEAGVGAPAFSFNPLRGFGAFDGNLAGYIVPGSKAADFRAELNAMKAQVFLPMVQSMKGMGALSNAEGDKLTAAIGALDTTQSETQFKASLDRIVQDLTAYKKRGMPNGGGSGRGGGLPRMRSVQEAYALPKGTRFIDPHGVERTRP